MFLSVLELFLNIFSRIAEVAGTLWALSDEAEIKAAIASAGAIPPLVALLGHGDSQRGREHAFGALASLGLENRHNQEQITLIEDKLGILGSLTEECFVPNGSEANFVEKLTTKYKDSKYLKKPLRR